MFRFALRSFHPSRSVLRLFLLLVEGFGRDDDGEVVGRTDRSTNARISDARHGEHDLITYVTGAVGRQLMSRFFLKNIMRASLTTARVWRRSLKSSRAESRGSSRVWSSEFVTERKFEPGDKVYAELYLWVRAREPVSQLGLVDILGDLSRPKGKKGTGGKNAASTGAAVPHHERNFLPGGPVSVGRINSCPLPKRTPSRRAAVTADGGDYVNVRDPIRCMSLPESSVGRTPPGCGSCSLS